MLDLNRRVDDLSESLKDAASGSVIRLDFDSFSEAEKLVFRKVDEIKGEYERTGSERIRNPFNCFATNHLLGP